MLKRSHVMPKNFSIFFVRYIAVTSKTNIINFNIYIYISFSEGAALKNCDTLKQSTHFQKIRGSIRDRSKTFMFSKISEVQRGKQRPGPRREFNHSPQIASKLRLSGALPLLPLYVFKACTGTTSSLLLRTVRILVC